MGAPVLWVLRAAWFVLPLAADPAVAEALDGASTPVEASARTLLACAWTAGLVAMLVPRASSLTAVRILVPAVAAVVVAAAIHGPRGADDAVALAAVFVAVAATWAAPTTDAFVDGSSYGDERRFALRVPPAALVGAVVAWLLVVAAPVAVVALAARAWVPGIVLAAAGAVGIRLGVPALHRLSRRWLVLVPAGLVVHDQTAMADPVLLRRADLRGVHPAEVSSTALDLTLGAGGLALELAFAAPIELPVAEGAGRARTVVATEATAALVAALRPGAFLRAAADRRLPVT